MSVLCDETFSLLGKGLKINTKGDVSDYVEIIRTHRVKKFIITGNTLGVEASQALAEALKEKSELEHVDLSDGFTGRLKEEVPKALSYFCDALMDKKHLKYLNLSDNALGPPGAQAISKFLSQASSLRHLYINNNGLGLLGGRVIAESLTQLRRNLCKDEEEKKPNEYHQRDTKQGLVTFSIGRNRLENDGAKEIAKALQAHCESLTEFAIPQNGIRAAGIIALSKELEKCKHIEIIDIQDNTFTLEGCGAFAQAMKCCSHIRTLNLNDCYLTSKGSSLIFKSLRSSPVKNTLEYLWLQYNIIKEPELIELIGIIPHLKRLQSLHLNGNAFDPDSETAALLSNTLERYDKSDALDSLSDMEYDESDEESNLEEESEGTQHETVDEKEKEFEKLADMMAKIEVDE